MRRSSMKHIALLTAALIAIVAIRPSHAQGDAAAALANRVRETERACAKAMADRAFAAFQSFLAEATVFWGQQPLRGKQAVAAAWKRMYDGPRALFSWDPETVEVLNDGTLAFSSGPVRDPEGKRTGTFNSVWR